MNKIFMPYEVDVPENLKGIKYVNYHKHTYYSNPLTPDCVISIDELAERTVELGHTTMTTVEHGWGGEVFEYYKVAKKMGLRLVFGVEFYYVQDRFQKDRTNAHLVVLAKNEAGRKALNELITESNQNHSYYHKPRIDKALLFSLNPEDVFVTSTCIASPYRLYDDECFIKDCYEYFGKNFMLEIHDNTHHLQVEFNEKIRQMHVKYEIPLIFATDTHYIHPEDSKWRDLLLRSKGIFYGDEEGFIMDFPDTDVVFERFAQQGVFTPEQVYSAILNTNVIEDFEPVVIDDEIKMPSIYADKTHEEKIAILKGIINEEWKKERKAIPKSEHKKYLEEIRDEMSIIEQTKTEDYFLLNYPIIKKAVEEYGGVLSRTGRGCFTEDSLVHTRSGLKSIKDVKVGDYVITKDGQFNRVYHTMKYDINEPLLQIKHAMEIGEPHASICTLDHRILVSSNGDDEPIFIPAEKVKVGNYVCMPKMKNGVATTILVGFKEDSKYYYIPVTEIISIEKSEVSVYDISVENEANYLLNNMIVHNSAPSFYLNKLLGFTEIDRIAAPITLYPRRFMSVSRILETRSLPDKLIVPLYSNIKVRIL